VPAELFRHYFTALLQLTAKCRQTRGTKNPQTGDILSALMLFRGTLCRGGGILSVSRISVLHVLITLAITFFKHVQCL